MVTKEMILELRAKTGAPVLACRKALEEARGDTTRALELLKARGSAVAAEKAGRATAHGTVGTYVHAGGTVAGMVLLRCETDFVARNPVFQEFARDLAMQVVAMNPQVVRAEETPAGLRPDDVALLAQPFIKDARGTQTVREVLEAKVLELGEHIIVERFARFAL